MFKIGNQTISSIYVGNQEIGKAYLGNELVYSKKEPLTFEIGSAGTVGFYYTLEVKKNNESWIEMTNGGEINVVAGDILKFRGDVTQWNELGFYGTAIISKIKGNLYSVAFKDNYNQITTLPSNVNFAGIFHYIAIIDASELLLPATTLSRLCYYSMFDGCTSLTAAPVLPATTLANSCYMYMFVGCTSLTAAPVLPATTLAVGCYAYMFWQCGSLTTAPAILPATTLAGGCYEYMFGDCTSLTTAPELPATALAQGCYSNMFDGCTSLNYIKCIATDISASDCTSNWVDGVASTGTFVKNPNMTGWSTGNNGIPTGWTIQNA